VTSSDGVGIALTRTATLFDQASPLQLSRGGRLASVEVAYETYGTLGPARDNAVFLCHALTGDAHAAGYHEGDTRPGWWDNLIGPGRPLDTDRLYVVCANLLGGCQGTTGPSTIDPDTGRAYGLDFPLLDMGDFVTVHRALLDHLGIEKLLAAFGGSLGGMQVLEWALTYPEDLRHAIVIAASSRLSAMNIAFNAVAREAITRDPGFSSGQYVAAGTLPDRGLSIARMMAHITYLSEEANGRQVRPYAAAGRARSRVRRGLRRGELPAPPRGSVPGAVRRAQLPVPHAGHRTTTTPSLARGRRTPPQPALCASWSPASPPTGGSPRRTPGGSCATSSRLVSP